MASSPEPIAALSQQLDAFFTSQRADTAEFGPEAAMLMDAAAGAVAGGKRLRAQFCLSGWQAVAEAGSTATATPDAAVITAAAALEVFHAAALVHDDIIDNSDTRRGRRSAHRRIESAHRDAGWSGDAAAFGRAGGILLGDLLVALSDDLFEQSLRPVAADRAGAARAQYARMRRDVTIGQFLDVAEESAHVRAADDEHARRALRVASLKSARYSVEQPLLIGGRLAGADEEQAPRPVGVRASRRHGLPAARRRARGVRR
ncbi:polyprenyl synthetase family protein [Microbacterium elymi]|uniref:Polyprenyl synthetase family protein n=1 Tax=Microbacterium elymi TaxID=2909587 RepID=A0ABY5NJ71_9MICO|nr:polyprenyl synthetase family protein [Microbacterium elymi]UUT35198.1 polyprenyl synthetase family protein [Microbacterium elymi]